MFLQGSSECFFLGAAFWGFTVSGARVLYFLRVRSLSLRVQGVSEFKLTFPGCGLWNWSVLHLVLVVYVGFPALGVMSPKVLGLRDVSMINRGFLKSMV